MTRPLASLIFAAALGLAQIAPTASLTGTVTDPGGAAIPNVHVRMVNVETGFERGAVTQADGRYLFNQMPVGLYRVESSASGFSQYRQSGVRLNVNTTATLDIRLTLGAVGESVSVTADASMVNTTSGALSRLSSGSTSRSYR